MIDDARVEELYEKLRELTNVDAAVKAAHVESINSRYKKEATNETSIPVESETVKKCPRCGSNLVLRTARNGANAGNQFWGCSSYPKCKYIENHLK